LNPNPFGTYVSKAAAEGVSVNCIHGFGDPSKSQIRQTWLLLGLVGVGAIAPFLISPANACTPRFVTQRLTQKLTYCIGTATETLK
jgi:hypothetical protein